MILGVWMAALGVAIYGCEQWRQLVWENWEWDGYQNGIEEWVRDGSVRWFGMASAWGALSVIHGRSLEDAVSRG